jgi:hypothetical protein
VSATVAEVPVGTAAIIMFVVLEVLEALFVLSPTNVAAIPPMVAETSVLPSVALRDDTVTITNLSDASGPMLRLVKEYVAVFVILFEACK